MGFGQDQRDGAYQPQRLGWGAHPYLTPDAVGVFPAAVAPALCAPFAVTDRKMSCWVSPALIWAKSARGGAEGFFITADAAYPEPSFDPRHKCIWGTSRAPVSEVEDIRRSRYPGFQG
jgi:hypothetical protein